MDRLTASRLARELDALGRPSDADRVRWAASCATCAAVSAESALSSPALTGDDDLDPAPSCLLEAALQDAELAGDIESVLAIERLLAGVAGTGAGSRLVA